MRAIFLVFGLICSSQACKVANVLGCFTDDVNVRLLTHQASRNAPMTQENCALMCWLQGYKLSGVEFGTQCFCDNQFNPNANPQMVPLTDCQSMPCQGDSSESCGGVDRVLVFEQDCSNPIPSFHSCLDPSTASQAFCDTTKSVDDRVDALVSQLSLDEQIYMLSPHPELGNTCECHTGGVPRLGISQWMWLDETNTGIASACLAPDRCVTTFNGPMGMGASFNTTSWQLKGLVFGRELRAINNIGGWRGSGNAIGLTGFGPNLNIARDPRFGRNSELPGEDPYLTGMYGAHMVQGMQTKDSNGHPLMVAFLKHFTAYSRETNRGHDSYQISPHDLWETYLPHYRRAMVDGGAAGVMCSYNAENGQPSCSNGYLLNQVLRSWNPNAIVTTDCGAVTNLLGAPVNAPSATYAVAYAINNGTDVEMGSQLFETELIKAVNSSLVQPETITAALKRTLRIQFAAGRFDPLSTIDWRNFGLEILGNDYHKQIQYEAALQSFVLLKNDKAILPLKPGSNIAVLGPQGVAQYGLLSDYFGDEVCFGGGYDCIPTIASEISNANVGGVTTVFKGVDVNSQDQSGIQEALGAASAADVVVLVLGIDKTIEYEGVDRVDTALPGLQESFALSVIQTGTPVVLVLVNGGALAIDALVAGPQAIVEAFNPAFGAKALAHSLFGIQNRWGKLPVTMYPHSYISQQDMTNYDMAVWPGRTYKYYAGTPLFPFGFGLSLTDFSVRCHQTPQLLTINCVVINVGHRAGDQVVQVYHLVSDSIRSAADHPIPLRALVAFTRVSLDVYSNTTLSFTFDRTDFEVVNKDGQSVQYEGTHTLTFTTGDPNIRDTSFDFVVVGHEVVSARERRRVPIPSHASLLPDEE